MEWTDVKPVLEATYRLLAESDRVTGQDVNRALGRTPDDEVTGRALEQLHKADYVRGHFVMQSSLPVLIESTEKGFQETSGWPRPGVGGDSQAVEQLLYLLDERIADEATSEEERGRLRRARDAVGDVGRAVLADVLAAYLTRMGGLDP